MYRNCWSLSGEKASPDADPDAGPALLMNTCVRYLPSGVNSWTRRFDRSTTYKMLSFDSRTPWTGLANFGDPSPSVSSVRGAPPPSAAPSAFRGPPEAPGPPESGSSTGGFPHAPHMRLNAPLSASKTTTRRLPYPSATYTSLVLAVTNRSPGLFTLLGSVLPLLTERPPISSRNFPLLVNLSIMSSDRFVFDWPLGLLPLIQTLSL